MTAPSLSILSAEESLALYERLLSEDPTAPSDLATAYLDRLADWLISHNPRSDVSLCETAAADAILGLIKNPATYQPERQTLEVYLRISASGDLRNLLRSERRHSKRKTDWETVEHSTEMGKYLGDEAANPEFILRLRQEEGARQPLFPRSVQINLTQEEMSVLDLMKDNERKTSIYAAVLGISHLPIESQKREVKRVKDRLKKRLERAKE